MACSHCKSDDIFSFERKISAEPAILPKLAADFAYVGEVVLRVWSIASFLDRRQQPRIVVLATVSLPA